YYDDRPALVSVETPVAPNMATHWGDVEQMNWDLRMVYDAVGLHFFLVHPNPQPVGACSFVPTYEKIHTCKNGCMLYWKDNIRLEYCKFCGDPRYKPTRDRNPQCKKSPFSVLRYLPLIPQPQRLYASPTTAEHMTWRACYQIEEGSMCHPSDAEAWRHFDQSYLDFTVEPHNVTLTLCTNGFAPHRSHGRIYSCWPVILTPYNLPPGMCMKPEYLFLMLVIPGPSSPKRRIDVYLEPLIEELLQLWHVGVLTHDHATNQAFMMRATLMWTVNYLSAYGMASGWSTTVEEPLTYPPGYGNVHKWIKKSIFLDLLYWNTHLIRHNLDVMHIEKNVFDNIFNTVMDIEGKTKDNLNAHKDLKNICNGPELEVDERRPNATPKVAYTLTKEQKKKICEWVRGLRFPDGYSSNVARYVDIANLRLHGMKNHDCHVFV
ncbi:UNVERIFIED_CONTAM: hypothetical protein Scaly_1003600, partial [Sesamum calycinum]